MLKNILETLFCKVLIKKITQQVLLLIVLMAYTSLSLIAQEGTKQWRPLSTGRGFLCYYDDPQNAGVANGTEGCPEFQRIYVYLKAGEVFNMGMRLRTGVAANTSVRVAAPSGTFMILTGSTLPANGRFTVPTTGTGFINTHADALAGPAGSILNGTTVVGGYTPFRFTATETGDHIIEFQSWTSTAFTTTDPNRTGGSASRQFEFFDVTVTDATGNIITNPSNPTASAGRLWSKQWRLQAGGLNLQVTPTFVVYTTDGFVNKVTLDMEPGGFTIMSNSFGVNNTEDAVLNRKSFRGDAVNTRNLTEHKVFVNDPDISVYPSNPVQPKVQVWFNSTLIFDFDNTRTPKQLPLTPGIIALVRNALANCPHESLAYFRVESNIAGQLQIMLDVNGGGYTISNSSPDVALFADVVPGLPVYLPWNIRDAQGNIHPDGASFDAQAIFLYAGVTHFPLYDVERMSNFTNEAIRPFQRLGPTLYWDDTNIPGQGSPSGSLTIDPSSANIQLNNPATPTGVVRRWVFDNNGTNPNNGNLNTLNTWFAGLELASNFQYSVSSPNICVNHDHDRDRYFDIVDLDDDNDGLCDVIEAGGSTHPNIDANNNRIPDWIENNPSGIIDPSVDNDADGIPNYRDADIAGFVDRNSDGINDNFDRDLDGKPDIFDLDSDNDGLKDYAEAGGTNDPNNNGIVGNDATVAGGANGSLLSSVTDVDRDGIIDLVDPIVFGGTIGTPLGAYTALSGLQVIINSDGDGLINARDMDSDNDGIRDVFELQATATASGGIIPNTVPIPYTNTDADADGLSDAWDTYFNLMNETPPFTAYGSAMGGTNINTPVNTDGLDAPDYLDLDSDNDVAAVPAGGPDWVEGFDDNENGFALEDLRTRAQTYEANNSFPGHYSNTDANSNGLPDWLDDAGGRPAFLTGGNAFFRDANGNGLADLFDEQTGGNGAYYAATATGQPDINNNGAPNYRDNTDLTTLRCSGIDLALAVSLSANNFCVPTTTNVLVANSEVGMTYQLQNDITGANIGAAQAGTGSTLTFPSGLVSATTTFRLQVTAAGGCVDQLNQKATVNINAAPSPASLGLTGNNPVLCNGAGTANLQINGTLPAGFSYRWYTTATGGTPIAGVTGNTYSVNLTGNTSFFVSVVNASGCESARLEVPVTVVTTNPIRLTASGNISDGVTPITLTGSGGVSYTWAPNDGSISGTGSVVTVRPTQTTLYTLTGTTAQGCIFTDTVTIRIALSGEEEIFIPSLFSPNGDNDNDFFLVYGRGIESIDLRVFDRAGNLVYRQTDVGKAINTGWDGKSNAQEQPIGMYVWSLSGKFNSGKPLKYLGKDTGKINLIR